MTDLDHDGPTLQVTPVRPRRRLSPRRRLANAVLGASAAGGCGAITVWLAAPPDRVVPWFVGGMALLGAALGYRHGRGVVRSAGRALLEAIDG
jgi:hypothetical protein